MLWWKATECQVVTPFLTHTQGIVKGGEGNYDYA